MFHPRRVQGFTLLEVVVAIALCVILILGMFSLSVSATQTRNFTKERDVAREAARAKLEEIMATDFDAIEATYFSSGDHFFNAGSPPDQLTSSVSGELAGKATLIQTASAKEPTLGAGSDGMKKIVVEIRWRGHNNAENTFELSGYVVNREAQ